MPASKDKKSAESNAKKPVSLRDKAKKSAEAKPKTRRVKQTVKQISRPVATVRNIGQKEYYLPLPDNKVGRFFNKKRHFIPRFFREAWQELKLVQWPNRKETTKLTTAVFIFAIAFGAIIAVVDFGLDKLFKELLLK